VPTIRVRIKDSVVKTPREIHTFATVHQALPAKTVRPVSRHFAELFCEFGE